MQSLSADDLAKLRFDAQQLATLRARGEYIAPWLDDFRGALLRACREFEERVGTIERGRGAKGDRVRSEILKRQLPFSISEIEEACPGISRDMVRVILRAMKTEGVIAPTGNGRSAKWSRVKAEGKA
jgi:hypothetical protein